MWHGDCMLGVDSLQKTSAFMFRTMMATVVGLLILGPINAETQQVPGKSDRVPVSLVMMSDLPYPDANTVVVRRQGRQFVLMQEGAATPAELVKAIAVLRAAWQVDGVEPKTEQVLRLRPGATVPAPDDDPEATYAADVMRRLHQNPRTDVAGVGRGRVLRAMVRVTAGGG